MLKRLSALCFVGIASCVVTTAAMADQLADIKSRGKLTVGIKNDYPPFGFIDKTGNVKGFEIDIAKALAKSLLGSEDKLEMVPVQASNRIELLNAGRIDVIFATLGKTTERARILDFTEEYYLMAGILLMAPKDTSIKTWNDVKGRKLCGIQGSTYNRQLQQTYGAELALYTSPTEMFNAFNDNRCEALAFDGPILRQKINEPDMAARYKIALDTFDYIPIAGGVRKGEPAFLDAVNKSIRSAEARGVMTSAETSYGMGSTDYVTKRAADAKSAGY